MPTTSKKSDGPYITRKKCPVVLIQKSLLEDEQISWAAKGVLCYLLAQEDGKHRWPRGVKDAFPELEEKGWIELIPQEGGGIIVRVADFSGAFKEYF